MGEQGRRRAAGAFARSRRQPDGQTLITGRRGDQLSDESDARALNRPENRRFLA
jgi:hypothetical protein